MANCVSQCSSESYTVCIINTKMFALTGPKTPEKDYLGFFVALFGLFSVQLHNIH